MRFPDTNVLIYSVNTDSAQHETAKRWLIEAFDEVGGIGLSWNTLLGFIRITTHPAILGRPLRVEQALQTIQVWLTHPSAQILTPLDGHAALLARLLLGAGGHGNLCNDAHLAALAIEHGATLGSFDKDFQRFAGLELDWLGAPQVS